MYSSKEDVENGSTFTSASLTTHSPPESKIKGLVRVEDAPNHDNLKGTTGEGGITDDNLLDLIMSFNDPKINLIKCGYCGLMARNLAVHVRLNHKMNKSFGFGFSGLSLRERNAISSKTFEAGIRHKRSVWIRRANSRLELSTYTT